MRAQVRSAATGGFAAIFLTVLGLAAGPGSSAAAGTQAHSAAGICPVTAEPGHGECAAALPAAAVSGTAIPGYTPAQLRGAYGLASVAASGGAGATVAIVTAYAYPDAASDLAVYRAHFRLPACPAGSCLRVLNENGRATHLPAANSSWSHSDAVALDAISALCPKCKLLLIEATSNSYADLGTAEDTAVSHGAKFVLNTWNGQESVDQDSNDHYFDHPGVAIVAPSGDTGYRRTFPGDLPYVTSVGGTTLLPSKYNTRHWSEIAWSETGSGCSAIEIKPSWQRADASAATGCPNRTQNDVAADADPATGAAVYDSYKAKTPWVRSGGTVLAAGIVTAAYALAGTPAPGTYPASYPYEHAGDLNDVLYGSNGPCLLSPDYICNAEAGFDGPTGLGTPDGTAAFSAAGIDPVTVLDPGTQDVQAGTGTDISIAGMDSRSGAALQYTAAGLPAGLTISALPHTLNAAITGTLPAAVRSYSVTVTAKDASAHKSGKTRFSLVATGSLAPSETITHSVGTDFTPPDYGPQQCLDGGAETVGTTVTDQLCAETLQQNNWSFVASQGPGSGGTLQINGLCLAPSGSTVALAACSAGSAAQSWHATYDGGLENGATGTCLDAGDFSGPLALNACDYSKAGQQWLVVSTLQTAVPGTCIGTYDYLTQPPTNVMTEPCGQSDDYQFATDQNSLRLGAFCVNFGYLGYVSTEANSYLNCLGGADDSWDPLPDGEILNNGNGLCLSDPGDSALPGNQLQLAPCDGSLGEIWAIG